MVVKNSDYSNNMRHIEASNSHHHNCTEDSIQEGYVVIRKNISKMNLLNRKLDSDDHLQQQTTERTRSQIQHMYHARGPQLLSCANISQFELGHFLGRGITKMVFKSTYEGDDVAVKIITPDVEDVQACLERGRYSRTEECYLYANYKLLKEITLALQLQHRNIVKVLATCYVYKRHNLERGHFKLA